MPNLYNQSTKEVLETLKTHPEKGLTAREVEKRRAQYGPNTIKVAETPLWKKLIAPFADVFMAMLIVALILSWVQGDLVETITIAVIIILNAAIYYVQRFSTERILKSLQRSTIQSVSVRRDGEEIAVDASELVPGDIVILREGDRIPADGRILSESGLLANEAMLTGESEPISKDAKALSGVKKVYEQRNMVFSGSFVITGTGEFIVTRTGNDTEYGRIASLASSLGEDSPIEQKMNKLIAGIAIAVVAIAAVVLVLQLLDGIEILSALEFTLAMVVSAVPEGLTIAISIILALCAKRMAAKKALIKELKAIESIGIVTTIASDKTGTLTRNRLEIGEVWAPDITPRDFRIALSHAGILETSIVGQKITLDPLDTAIWDYLSAKKHGIKDLAPIKTYAFDQSLKLSGNLYRNKSGHPVLSLKGAPEVILARSGLSYADQSAAEAKLVEFANRGFKVIAIATAAIDKEINELTRLPRQTKFQFLGLIAVADAIRKEAPAAIKATARMGVKTKMVTGDHAGTAYAIGHELGLAQDPSEVLDCSKLGNISDSDLAEIVKTTTIFARVTPEDKYRILSAIKQTEICAMTGDGVNDVPALVGAHVGIAMGDSPSIVQDAGDIVLIDNNFKSIADAIKESRTVLTNIRRMLVYLLATNAGEVITMVSALLLSGHQLLNPVQILWINLVTDSLMVIPVGLEPPETAVLSHKPEPKDAPILSGCLLIRTVTTAVIMTIGTLITYYLGINFLGSHEAANTLAFTALVVMQWSSAFSLRGLYESAWRRLKVKHTIFHLATFAAIILQVLVVCGPLMSITETVAVPIGALALTALASFFIPLVLFELIKRLFPLK